MRKILGKEALVNTDRLTGVPRGERRHVVRLAYQGLKRAVEDDPKNSSSFFFLLKDLNVDGPAGVSLIETHYDHDSGTVTILRSLNGQVPQRTIEDLEHRELVHTWRENPPAAFRRNQRGAQ